MHGSGKLTALEEHTMICVNHHILAIDRVTTITTYSLLYLAFTYMHIHRRGITVCVM